MAAPSGAKRQGAPSDGEEMPMAKVYHQIINLTNKPPSLRTDDELEQLVPWLRKKSSNLFHDLENAKITRILREADFRRYRFDDVIIRQGDQGFDSKVLENSTVVKQQATRGTTTQAKICGFYILISGGISFFVNTTDDVEGMVLKQKQEETEAKDQGRPVNRDVYGTQVGTGTEGKTFGELALIHADCVRNATVISTNFYTDVLVVSKDLYKETILGSQVREFEAKEKFVSECPLFHKWSPKLRKMAAMSVEKIKLKFEDVIVKQGSPVNGLHFLVSGQVKIRVDPSMHPTQFQQQFPVGDIADLEKQKAREVLRKEMNLSSSKHSGKRTTYLGRSGPHPEGGKKTSQRALELCLMGAVDTIGDLEMVLNWPSYSQTVVCTEAATVFHLDQRNYDRLVEKKNPQTVDLMRDIVHTKLTLHFSRLPDDAIPLYRYVLYMLDDRERETREKNNQQRRQQQSRGKSTTATPTTDAQYDIDSLHKGPLVNLYGPGSVFHWIRTKAKERKLKQKREKAVGNSNNPAFRFGQNPLQTSPIGRTPLGDNARFMYADETSSIHDDQIVNLYGYNENTAPRFVHGDMDEEYDMDMPMFDDLYETEDQDWATSDSALSNLEDRLMRWHSSFTHSDSHSSKKTSSVSFATSPSSAVPPSMTSKSAPGQGDRCVVKLHRFYFVDDNRPKPGNKVYVRGRGERRKELTVSVPPSGDQDDSSPELDSSFAKYLLSAPRTPQVSRERQIEIASRQSAVSFEEGRTCPKVLLPKRANSAGVGLRPRFPSAFSRKSQSRHQYTKEEYLALKQELRRRQKAYKSFLPQTSIVF